MKITDLFNQEWSQDTLNNANAMTEALLNENEAAFENVQHTAVFHELLCEVITNDQSFQLTSEVGTKLIDAAKVYSALITMNADGHISFAQDAEGEEVVVF